MLDLPATSTPPAFADAGAVVADCFAELRFPEKVSVSECARRHRVLVNPQGYSGPWADSPHDMRFLDRPMDMLHADSPYDEVMVDGPSQTAKSEIGNNWQLHTIHYDQADFLSVMADKTSMQSYVTTQFAKMIDNAVAWTAPDGTVIPAAKDRQLAGGADNVVLKQFRGADMHFLHPASSTFRSRPFSRGREDDYDDFPDDVGGEGDGLSGLKGRMGSFEMMGRTKVYINSTPKKGDRAGIVALRLAGTNEHWWVDCLDCGEPFELDTENVLKFDTTGTAEDAAASAGVVCPSPTCGVDHKQADKRALMGTGRWVGRGEQAVSRRREPEGKTGELVKNNRASFHFDGLMGMRSWAVMARQWRAAEITYATSQDEGPLRAFYQNVIGKNYTPRGTGEPGVTEEELLARTRQSTHRLRTVPNGATCLIASIDQHGNRFEVAVWAFGSGFRAWLVDRFEILTIDRDGRAQKLRPFIRPEDWSVLHQQVLSLTYPMADGRAGRMKIFCTAVDTGGLDNATDNAFQWWHAMVTGDVGSGRPKVPATALTLIKGNNRPQDKLLPPPTIDAKRQIKGAPQAELYRPNVNRVKDITDTRLKIADGGGGSITFPGDTLPRRRGEAQPALVAAPWIAEMRAEENIDGQWTRPDHRANETLDLYVYAFTVVLRFADGDASMAWVPEWARPPRGAPRKLPAPVQAPAEERDDDTPPREPSPAPAAPSPSPGSPQRRGGPRRSVRVHRAR